MMTKRYHWDSPIYLIINQSFIAQSWHDVRSPSRSNVSTFRTKGKFSQKKQPSPSGSSRSLRHFAFMAPKHVRVHTKPRRNSSSTRASRQPRRVHSAQTSANKINYRVLVVVLILSHFVQRSLLPAFYTLIPI